MKRYDFNQQLSGGAQGEAFLDKYFADRFAIRQATSGQQRLGIDRFFTPRQGPTIAPFAVEYKTDTTAGFSGNAFIETTSIDSTGKRGWAYTSQAEWLIYYIPARGLIYTIRLAKLRQKLAYWADTYPVKTARNRGYSTHGLIVPLTELARCADRTLTVDV